MANAARAALRAAEVAGVLLPDLPNRALNFSGGGYSSIEFHPDASVIPCYIMLALRGDFGRIACSQ